MLKYTETEVVFKEVPDEIALAINISGCPCRCPGCHSTHLWEDIGYELNEESIRSLIGKNKGISCISFMGGDASPEEINNLAKFIKSSYPKLKVSWYSGKTTISDLINLDNFDYIKIGPYVEEFGGLDSPTTNQIFYKVSNKKLIDITERFKNKF